jgi:PAS domain S-box-containing protein
MAHQSDVRRITRALNWIGAGALGFGILVVVWALWWTRGVDDFRTAVIVAAIGFGLPSVVVLWVAWLLDSLMEKTSSGSLQEPLEAAPAQRSRAPEWPRALRYCVAIGVVVAAAVVRWWLDPILVDKSPFITFFLAVTIAAWVGGFGASALATALSIAIAWQWFLRGPGDLPPDLLRNVVAAGVFAATALAIGGITGALRAAARFTGELSAATPSRAAELRTIEGELQRDRDLRADESRIHAMADNAPVLIWMSDPSGMRDHFNRQWLEFTGCTLDEALGRRWEAAVHPQDLERYLRTCNAASDARAPFRWEYRLRRFDGEYRWVLDEGVPRFLPDGTFAGYIGACMDITDRKSAQHLLAVLPPESEADRDA